MENGNGNVVLSHARPATATPTATAPPFLTLSLSPLARACMCVCGWLFTLSHFHHCVSFPPLSCALLSSSRMCRRMWAVGFEGGGACQVGACPSRQLLLNCIILRPLMDDCYGPCSSILASPPLSCHSAILPSWRPASWLPFELLIALAGSCNLASAIP